MRAVGDQLPSIDNTIYDRLADTWWSEDGFLNLLQSTLNPWRVPYFKRVLVQLGIRPQATALLDVGCGGGLLAEEFASMGFDVTGIDPSEASLAIARTHAKQKDLTIEYQQGGGEQLPFKNVSFKIVICCDVLEHIREWTRVIGEIARVLERGGVLFYDTINRTNASKIRSIKMAQEWSWTRYAPPNTHVWEMFITPEELGAALEQYGLRDQDKRGTAPKGNPAQAVWLARQFKRGKITTSEFGKRIDMTEGNILSGSYMGYATKS